MRIWRLILSPAADIFAQMKRDEELFEETLQDVSLPPALRIYRVDEPGVTLGYGSQVPVRGAVFDKFPANFPLTLNPLPQRGRGEGEGVKTGYEFIKWRTSRSSVCVRPTGGGAVFHGNDLIYSVVARQDSFTTFGRVRTSTLSFHEAIQGAFLKLGIETELFRCDEPTLRENAKRRIRDCFREPVPTDVALGGRKIAGGAERRKAGAFLHQGSIQLVKGITYERLREALIAAFEEKFEISWADSNKMTSRGEPPARQIILPV